MLSRTITASTPSLRADFLLRGELFLIEGRFFFIEGDFFHGERISPLIEEFFFFLRGEMFFIEGEIQSLFGIERRIIFH